MWVTLCCFSRDTHLSFLLLWIIPHLLLYCSIWYLAFAFLLLLLHTTLLFIHYHFFLTLLLRASVLCGSSSDKSQFLMMYCWFCTAWLCLYDRSCTKGSTREFVSVKPKWWQQKLQKIRFVLLLKLGREQSLKLLHSTLIVLYLHDNSDKPLYCLKNYLRTH